VARYIGNPDEAEIGSADRRDSSRAKEPSRHPTPSACVATIERSTRVPRGRAPAFETQPCGASPRGGCARGSRTRAPRGRPC
jgi:hypothetical protein